MPDDAVRHNDVRALGGAVAYETCLDLLVSKFKLDERYLM